MKSIALVTDGKNIEVEEALIENLNAVFKGYVKINNYYFKNLSKNQIITDDIVLVMIKERAIRIKEHVLDRKRIVVVNRTIREGEIYKLFSLPEKIDVLVVNDNMETTIQTTALLYELGVNHLNLIPYDENKSYENIKIAVTPGECDKVPKYIERVIDLGQRCIDISTFLNIMNKLKIGNKEISRRIVKYSEQVISLDTGIKERYKELVIKNDELDSIINLSNDGILAVSNKGIITVCNESLKKIFNINEDIIGKNINKYLNEDTRKIFDNNEEMNGVYKFKNRFGEKYVNVNKKNIFHFGKKNGMYYNIQEITYIRQLEQNLSKKLRENGQIARYNFEDIQTNSISMNKTKILAKKIASVDFTVLITGESGTGKELFAQSIHNASKRSKQPFIAVNCAAMPENLLESELFGYESGAFTGALKSGKRGLFEQANNGTIFLDEIGDMPLHLQTKLLRVLQEKQVMRIGAERVIDIDVRIIAATNRDLLRMVNEGEFRADLYYRINVFPINIPPLRERKEDIIILLKHFINRKVKLSDEVISILMKYDWPGNIRELKNVAIYIETMCESDIVKPSDLPFNLMNVKSRYICEMRVLEDKNCLDESLKIMRIIYENNMKNKSIGRNNIVKILQDVGITLTEGEVRGVLSLLNELDFITCSVGRRGSKITRKGIEFLTRFDKLKLISSSEKFI
ncbi:transcriptional regulatory protein QseF [Clostridium tepidiprofundi DSM 19306]|uniref:Transcriptional regulatory protein QseF n=1 Tax=Clostridium tepidiprofundi DSM 19306 TaxID=1121338 RepID=A0A151B485_9CLOT|nr:sigma 54-interacting transcriptional regulator [Clostridium tepidiprofundi]KYH34572.1 transcriptional regulatory protein QseF [Clostridium tepidiprofundi DSM 19306]